MTKTKNNTTPEITIPVNIKLLLRAGREYRPLRLFVISYCKKNRIAGFKPFVEPPFNSKHNELFDENGNLIDKPKTSSESKKDGKPKK